MTTSLLSQTVDARGLASPIPIIRLAQAAKAAPSGALLVLLATAAGSTREVSAWCRSTGNQLVDESADGMVLRFVVRRC